MSALILLCVSVASATIISGVWCICLRVGSKNMVFLSFGILAVLVGIDLILVAEYVSTDSAGIMIDMAIARFVLSCIIYTCAVWFFGLYSQTPKLYGWLLAFGLLYLIPLVAVIASEGRIMHLSPQLTRLGVVLGQPVYNLGGPVFPPPAVWSHVVLFLLFLWSIWQCVAMWRRGSWQKALPLAAYLVLQLCLIGFDNATVAQHRPPYIPLAPFGFICLIIIMGGSLYFSDRQRETEMSGTLRTLHAEIARRRNFQSRLTSLSGRDLLRGAPERRLLNNTLESTIAAYQASGQHGAVVVLTLDGLRHANNTLGYDAGDKLFLLASARLSGPGVNSLTWFGEDEYALILTDLGEDATLAEAAALQLAESLRDKLNEPLTLDGTPLTFNANIGVAVFPSVFENGHSDSQDLLRQADMALYRAKAACYGAAPTISERIHQEPRLRDTLSLELADALDRNEIEHQFRPQVDTDSRLVGFEMRQHWDHPRCGRISPRQLMLLTEDVGLLKQMSEYIIASACDHLQKWQDMALSNVPRLATNISHAALLDAKFVRMVKQRLVRSGIDPNLLTLEISEQAIIQNVDSLTRTLRELNILGVRLAIDDFGAGYAAMDLIKKLPLNEAKLDRVFVGDLPARAPEQLIAKLVESARQAGLYVVAAGVDTKAQRETLMLLGCSAFQGDFIGKPSREPSLDKLTASGPTGDAIPV